MDQEKNTAPAPKKPDKPEEPEYYTLKARPPQQNRSKEDMEIARIIANRYLTIPTLEKLLSQKRAWRQKRQAAMRYKTPETPEEFYERAQRYLGGAECAVPFQERVHYLRKAADMFAGAGDYNDAPELAKKYANLADETEKDGYERAYAAAVERRRTAQTSDDWFEAARAFERIPGYLDADAQAAECQHILDRRANWKKPLLLLRVALIFAVLIGFILFSRTDRFRYNLARTAHRMGADSVAAAFLSSDNSYGDTDSLLEEIYYDVGVEHMEKGEYKKALNSLQKCTAFHSDMQSRLDECNYALGANAFDGGHNKTAKEYFKACSEGYKDCEERICQCSYNQALDSLKEEKLEDALDHFLDAKGYSDTAQLRYEPELTLLRQAAVGDVVYFGTSNYVVLERTDSTATLLAKRLAPDLLYHRRRESVDWSTCSLRTELNAPAFLDSQFSEQEQALLQPLDGDGDRVSILSREEYLRCQEIMGTKDTLWWLRDQGEQPDQAMFVSNGGEVMEAGYPVDSPAIGARPVIQIQLSE